MFRASTSRWLRRLGFHPTGMPEGRGQRPASPRRRTDRSPRFESLESRWVLNYSITVIGQSITIIGSSGQFIGGPAINGLNNKGAFVGSVSTSANGPSAFEYNRGQLIALSGLGGDSAAQGINDRGTIVGYTDLGTTPTSSQQAVFVNRRGRTIVVAPSVTIGKLSINNKNQITGFSGANGDDVLVKGRKQIDIGSLAGQGSVGLDLNNKGVVVGESNVSGGTHAFVYARGKMTDLGTLGGSISEAQAVNNKGQIAGDSTIAGDSALHAFLDTKGRMIDLGTLGGSEAFAHSINDRGVIVGTSFTTNNAGEHAFIDQDGVMTDLNTLIPANSGMTLVRAVAINNKGQIVAEASTNGSTNSNLTTVLLTPTR